MNNPLWEWLIETRRTAYLANEDLRGPSSLDAGPMWCFERFGQSTSQLPDGRTVLIGGEHEDFYDADFYIYNDLVVDGRIHGYPAAAFPPTDFHSATVSGDRIILIGSLGYPEDRRIGQTQMLAVDCRDWSISRIDSHGQSPGWLHKHQAAMQGDGAAILVTGGLVCRSVQASLIENIDDWLLHLDGWRWERLTERRWERFEVYREDRKPNHLWALGQALWDRSRNRAGHEDRRRRRSIRGGLLQRPGDRRRRSPARDQRPGAPAPGCDTRVARTSAHRAAGHSVFRVSG